MSTELRGPGILSWMKVSWRPYVAVDVLNKYQKRQKDKLLGAIAMALSVENPQL